VLVRAVNYGVKTLLEALTGGHTADPKAVFDMLDHGDETLVYNARNSLMMLAREISSSIGFFEGRHEETISRIFVSGAAARKSVLTLLTEDLQVPCEQWNPFENCEISLTGNQSEFLEHKSSLNIACGAAAELLRSN
jgi:Tfp pilus assembly PilM family ATPase